MRLIEYAGRRRLLLSSLAGVVGTLSILALCFKLSDDASPAAVPVTQAAGLDVCSAGTLQCASCLASGCSFCLDEQSQPQTGWCLSESAAHQCSDVGHHVAVLHGCPSPYRHFLVGLIMAYLLAFSVGMGPVPWAVNAEIYPLHMRGVASGIAGTANWLTNGVVSQTFLLLVTSMRASGTFVIYAAIAAQGFIWAAVFLPETKGLTLDEVQRMFARHARLRQPARGMPANVENVALVSTADCESCADVELS
jgi:MFS transporter, SP family, solute carrier family 2 (myo-inositol transporter), member 13